MRDRSQLAQAMESVRDQVLAIVGEHEQAVHGGAPCWLERCNAVAYLGHCLGLSTDRLQTIGRLLFDHDVHCVKNGGCAQHRDSRKER